MTSQGWLLSVLSLWLYAAIATSGPVLHEPGFSIGVFASDPIIAGVDGLAFSGDTLYASGTASPAGGLI